MFQILHVSTVVGLLSEITWQKLWIKFSLPVLSGFVVKMLEIPGYDVTFPNMIIFGQFSKTFEIFVVLQVSQILDRSLLIVFALHAPHFSKKIKISSISHIIAQFCHHCVEREKSSQIDPLIIKIGYKMADLFNSEVSKKSP